MKKNITILNLPGEKYYDRETLEIILEKILLNNLIVELERLLSFEDVVALIQKSDLLIIPGTDVFLYYGTSLMPSIISYFKNGGNILYSVEPNVTGIQNEFLGLFEMGYAGIRLRPAYGYDVPFANSTHSFRDRYLYKDLDNIYITQPNNIEFWGGTQPILMSNGNFMSIDSKTDLRSDFPSNMITSIAINESKNGGIFFCKNGHIQINNEKWLKDDNEKNEKFLCNIYNMLLNKTTREEIAYSLYRQIEQHLSFIVFGTLNKHYKEDYLSSIPENIILKLNERNSEIQNIQNELDFIQLKKIIEHNWIIFKTIFTSDNEGSKKKVLSWMDWVNELRKKIAHPTRDMENNLITYDNIQKLRDIIEVLIELKRNLK